MRAVRRCATRSTGSRLELPLHPALTDVPLGSWTAALVFDGLDAATDSRAMRNAADTRS